MIRYLWSFGNTRIVFKEKSQMKSSGGLLFTAWLLLMAWCLFSNRVSTATVVGNGYLQVVTCKYLIFCSLDKYILLVPHQVCAFAQKRLIELKSTLVGGARGLINFRPRFCTFHFDRLGWFGNFIIKSPVTTDPVISVLHMASTVIWCMASYFIT